VGGEFAAKTEKINIETAKIVLDRATIVTGAAVFVYSRPFLVAEKLAKNWKLSKTTSSQ